MKAFSVGSDPEMMVFDPKTNQVKSAIGIVHGTKEKKLNLGNGHEAFYDNVLAECNIKPANNVNEFIDNIRDCYQRYAKVVHPYQLVPQASHTYLKSELQHEDAMAFGCDPSYDAYQVIQNDPPACDPQIAFRTAGGHIHLGGDFFPLNDDWGKIWAVRMMDLFIGIPSIFIDHDPTSPARRALYGRAGDHRPQIWGVEYRSLSNYWLASPEYVSLIWELCNFTLDVCINQQYEDIFNTYKPKNICQAINTGNKKLAKPFMDICHKLMPDDIWNKIQKLTKPQTLDFYSSWGISLS